MPVSTAQARPPVRLISILSTSSTKSEVIRSYAGRSSDYKGPTRTRTHARAHVRGDADGDDVALFVLD